MFAQQDPVPSNALLASHKVRYIVAKCKKPHIIAEELFYWLLSAWVMVNFMVGESVEKRLSKVTYFTILLIEESMIQPSISMTN